LLIAASEDSPVPFEVSEVLRTKARQAELLAAGASSTMNSRHLAHPSDGLSRAADIFALVGGKARWEWALYVKIAAHIKAKAKELGISITWGGDWKSLRDGPHFELNRKAYP
jgi:peptidoglycan L-alanyl-D-glutamate endopeptidase CwlK